MSATLYEISNDIAALAESLLDGEMSPEIEMRLDQLIGEELPAKVDGYARLIIQWDREADMIEAERDRLAAMVSARTNSAKRLRDRLFDAMRTIGETKIKTLLFTASVCKNSQPTVDVSDVAALPVEFQRVTVEPNKLAIGRAWKDGVEVPGAVVNQNYHLRIK
jgi:hypothetical protein